MGDFLKIEEVEIIPVSEGCYKERVLITSPKNNVSQYFYSLIINIPIEKQKIIEAFYVNNKHYIKLEDGSSFKVNMFMISDDEIPQIGDEIKFKQSYRRRYIYTHSSYLSMPPLYSEHEVMLYRNNKHIKDLFIGGITREPKASSLPKNHLFKIKFNCPGDFGNESGCQKHVQFDKFWPEMNFSIVSADKLEDGSVFYVGNEDQYLHFAYEDGSKVIVKPLYNGLPRRFSPIPPRK